MSLQPCSAPSKCGSLGAEATDSSFYVQRKQMKNRVDIKPNTAVGKTGYIWKTTVGDGLPYINVSSPEQMTCSINTNNILGNCDKFKVLWNDKNK
jgi:hypothetical protein